MPNMVESSKASVGGIYEGRAPKTKTAPVSQSKPYKTSTRIRKSVRTFSTGVGLMPRSLNLTWGELGSIVMSVDIIFTSSTFLKI